MRKTFPDAQKLSGRQCRRADGVFLPLSLLLLLLWKKIIQAIALTSTGVVKERVLVSSLVFSMLSKAWLEGRFRAISSTKKANESLCVLV